MKEESSEDLGTFEHYRAKHQNYRLEMESQALEKTQQEAQERIGKNVSTRNDMFRAISVDAETLIKVFLI